MGAHMKSTLRSAVQAALQWLPQASKGTQGSKALNIFLIYPRLLFQGPAPPPPSR